MAPYTAWIGSTQVTPLPFPNWESSLNPPSNAVLFGIGVGVTVPFGPLYGSTSAQPSGGLVGMVGGGPPLIGASYVFGLPTTVTLQPNTTSGTVDGAGFTITISGTLPTLSQIDTSQAYGITGWAIVGVSVVVPAANLSVVGVSLIAVPSGTV